MNIEEAIKQLNNLVKDFNINGFEERINATDIQAIETIIEAYNRQKEINEEHQKINSELREEINRIKSLDIYSLVEDWETGKLISKDKIKEKIEEIMEEHSKILADNKRSLMEQNIASHQCVAMRNVLEELLEEGE